MENSRGLDLPRRDGGLLVVGGELAGLSGDALKDVVHEGVEDGHGTVGDTSVGVDLLEDWRGGMSALEAKTRYYRVVIVDCAGCPTVP